MEGCCQNVVPQRFDPPATIHLGISLMFTQVIIPFVLMSKMIPTKKKTTKKTVLEDASLSFHSCVALRFLLQAVWKTGPGGITGVLKTVSEHGTEGAGV